MKRIVVSLLLIAAFVTFAAHLAQAATPEDAKALADKALVFWKANGKDKAVAEFNNPKGQFVKGDLYIVVQDFQGGVLAHGGNPGLVGKSLFEQKDPSTGKLFVQDMIEIAKTKGSGWLEYDWINPVSKKLQPKKSWVVRVEGENYFVVCGAFK